MTRRSARLHSAHEVVGGGQDLDGVEAAVTLGAVVLGAVVSQVGVALEDRRQERRRERAERTASHLAQLRDTRKLARALVEQQEAMARGDLAGAAAAGRRMEELEEGDLHLIGDDRVALEFRELIVHLNNRFGRGLSVEDMIRSVEMQGQVATALARQEDRARSGKDLVELSESVLAQLSDVRAMADRMVTIGQAPSMPSMTARLFIDFKRRLRTPRRSLTSDQKANSSDRQRTADRI